MAINDINANKFTPLVGYWCLPNGDIDDSDRRVLTDLYLPIMGMQSFSLYLLLWQKIPNKKIITDRGTHGELMSLLGISLKGFYDARIKAEALGLIKTYKKVDDIGPYYIYQLFEPLKPYDFFNDDLMSILLYEQIDDRYYKKLVKKYSQNNMVLENSENVTKGFLDVFQLNNMDLINMPKEVRGTQKKFKQPDKEVRPNIIDTDTDFDLNLVYERVNDNYHVKISELKENENLFLTLHAVYGIDEMNLIEFVRKSIIMDSGISRIDTGKLKKKVQEVYRKNVKIKIKETEVDRELKRASDDTFNAQDKGLLQTVRSKTPADFLRYMREKDGDTVNQNDIETLTTVGMKYDLEPEVINVLINYCFIYSGGLTYKLMNTVAEDWQFNGVNTPEQALKRIHDRDKKRKSISTNRPNGIRKVEQATDWSKVTAHIAENDEDYEKKQKELNKKLERIRRNDK